MTEDLLQRVIREAQALSPDQVPGFMGQLETARVTALARLSAPAPQPKQADELLGIEEAARRLGVTRSFLYHRKNLPFVRHMGRKLLFSTVGIEQYISTRR